MLQQTLSPRLELSRYLLARVPLTRVLPCIFEMERWRLSCRQGQLCTSLWQAAIVDVQVMLMSSQGTAGLAATPRFRPGILDGLNGRLQHTRTVNGFNPASGTNLLACK